MAAAKANLARLNELHGYERVRAPFDGVITQRNTDIGQLIDSGSSGGSKAELFHIAAPDPLAPAGDDTDFEKFAAELQPAAA